MRDCRRERSHAGRCRNQPLIFFVSMDLSDGGLPGHSLSSRKAGMANQTCSPPQVQSDLSRHAAWKADDLGAELVAERPQLLVEEFKALLRKAFEGAGPLGIGDVDAAASITA